MLKKNDCFRIMCDKQVSMQERLGRLSKARSSSMPNKVIMVKEEIFDINKELGEMLENLHLSIGKDILRK